MLKQVLASTPFYVWLILIFLIKQNIKLLNKRVIRWKKGFFFPTIMLIWSLSSLDYNPNHLVLWILIVVLGIQVGVLSTHNLDVRYHRNREFMQIQGSTFPLILSISLFGVKYATQLMYATSLPFKGSFEALWYELLVTLLSGILMGRILGYLKRANQYENYHIE